MSGIEVNRSALVEALRHVNGAVDRSSTVPILAHALVRVEGGEMVVRATDFDLQAEARLPATGEGAFTADAARLLAAADTMVGDRVTLSEADGKLTMRAGRSMRTILTLSANDFPLFEPPAEAVRFSLPVEHLARLLSATRWASASEGLVMPAFCGVLLHVADGQLMAAATDKNRLAVASAPMPDGAEGMPETTIPSKCVDLIAKIAARGEGMAAIAVGDGKIGIAIGGVQLSSKLIDLPFIDYRRIILPRAGGSPLSLTAGELARAATAATAILTPTKDGKVTLRRALLVIDDEGVRITATGPNGSAVEPVEAVHEGPHLMVGFNAIHLRDAARAFADDDRLQLMLGDAQAPIMVRSEAAPDIFNMLQPLTAG